jgi:hypothetical protein
LKTPPTFQNSPWFWKPYPLLETGTGFGNSPHFPKLPTSYPQPRQILLSDTITNQGTKSKGHAGIN